MTEEVIPATLEEAVEAVLAFEGCAEAMDEFKGDFTKFVGTFHHTVGRSIRNNWNLWKGCGACPVEEAPLYYELYRQGLRHPDDMSGVILKAAWCRHFGDEYEIGEDIATCLEYWEMMRQRELDQITDAVEAVIAKY